MSEPFGQFADRDYVWITGVVVSAVIVVVVLAIIIIYAYLKWKREYLRTNPKAARKKGDPRPTFPL
ncbi:Hypothetical predicted protein [Mytilus galloprovincialis]|uniref:Uncharacterized protein n=1 Tax=Mytilus galloprovincialis TaxID=29158 RepID=A0A8B6G5B5_MYTGA|nr:Hypothetical predicted protein [Mytilus galloprovincialis]